MLKQRVLTAIVLVAVLLGLLLAAPPIWVSIAFALFAAAAAWEWGGLAGYTMGFRYGYAALFLLISFILHEFPAEWWLLWALSGVFWILLAPCWIGRVWRITDKPLVAGALGLVLLLATWSALLALHQRGTVIMLAVLATVWIADIAAYFAGRRWGKHKLAPAISPGKTREGALGALVAVVGYGLLAGRMVGLWGGISFIHQLIIGVLLVMLTVCSILGDLFESLLKRQAGIKDSSQLLPGHGGVLDRIDSLMSTLPLVALGLGYLE